MKKTLSIAAFVAILGIGTSAFAYHCPADMAKIDKALGMSPKLTAEQMTEVAKLRAEGEAQHKAGDHGSSVKTLEKAMEILGIK